MTSTPSVADATSSDWTFTPTGDGAYTVTNAKSGGLLGVGSTTTAQRAWGTVPTVSAATTPSAGQEWFVVPDTNATTGAATGTFRLVNRYSGLVLGMSGGSDGVVQTTPGRTWDVTSSSVDALPLAAQQTLTFAAPAATGTTTPTPTPTPTPTTSASTGGSGTGSSPSAQASTGTTSTTSSNAALASTGSNLWLPLLVAGGVLLLGAAVFVLDLMTRRRRALR